MRHQCGSVQTNARATWMYLGLFFNPRGGHAMIEHFEKAKQDEAELIKGA